MEETAVRNPERTAIPDMKAGQTFRQAFGIRDFCIKETKTGKPYAAFTAYDACGSLPVKLWDAKEGSNLIAPAAYSKGGAAWVEMSIQDYNGQKQGNATLMRPLCPEEESLKGDLVKRAPIDPVKTMEFMKKCISEIQDPDLKGLCQKTVEQAESILMKLPAAKSMHHDCLGGWLYHTGRIVTSAKYLTRVYKELNADLLVAGAFLHDIGKLEEFKISGLGLVDSYTVSGCLLSHNILGILYLEPLAKELNMPKEKFECIAHIIESHHGRPEYGSAIGPMFKEAEVISHLDMMDSRIWMYDEMEKQTPPGQISDKHWGLGHSIYHPPYDSFGSGSSKT